MSSNVVTLERLFRRKWDWSSSELAEFYRVESALIQAGLKIETERGTTDEGDPWFAFCRQDDGEVIVHVARVDGAYVLAGPTYDGIARGNDIRSLVHDLVSRHPLIQTGGNGRPPGSNIFLHPAALLTAVIATAFFKSTEAHALTAVADVSKDTEVRAGGVPGKPVLVLAADEHNSVVMEAAQSAVILSAIASVLQDGGTSLTGQEFSAPEEPTSTHMDSAAVSDGALAAIAAALSESAPQPQTQQNDGSVLQDQVEASTALPLVVVLWDLAHKSGGQDISFTGDAAATRIAIQPDPVGAPSPALLHVTLATPEGNEGLPAVQEVKISYSGPQGEIAAHTIPQLDQVPQAILDVLRGAAHTAIDGQPQALTPNESFAESLIVPIAHPSFSPPAVPTEVPVNAPTVPASVAQTSPPVIDTSAHDTAQTAPSTLPHNFVDLQVVLQEFFKDTPNWAMVDSGKAVVVYDPSVLAGHVNDAQSMTFNFSDGSTLSLVGLPAALPYSHVA